MDIKRSQRKRGGKRRISLKHPFASQVMRALNAPPGNAVLTRKIAYTQGFTSTAGGVLNSIFTLDPANSTSTAWSNLAAVFDEWRFIGARIHIGNRDFATATAALNNVGCIVYDDNDASTPLASVTDAFSYEGIRQYMVVYSDKTPPSLTVDVPVGKAASIDWQTTTTTSTPARSFKMYADTLTASQVYGTAIVEIVVQLRMPKY